MRLQDAIEQAQKQSRSNWTLRAESVRLLCRDEESGPTYQVYLDAPAENSETAALEDAGGPSPSLDAAIAWLMKHSQETAVDGSQWEIVPE